jgi:DhnA family fructose-bisphosphate aldolase class Ia
MTDLTENSCAGFATGKARRFRRIFSSKSGRTIIVPVDDGLIFGPFNGLQNMQHISHEIGQSPANAVLSFPGTFRANASELHKLSWIMNLTASTNGPFHTRKIIVGSAEGAIANSADAVAVHVNCTDDNEREMLSYLGLVVRESEPLQMPVMAIMYPRRCINGQTDDYVQLRETDPAQYARMVAHAVRIGAELGADLIKTKYTGDAESFRTVVASTPNTPIVIAGGEFVREELALASAEDAISAGCAGICFGRNVYQRSNVREFLIKLGRVVNDP